MIYILGRPDRSRTQCADTYIIESLHEDIVDEE